jgi:hypothetical protein
MMCILSYQDNSTFVDWSPCDFGDDDYELQSSDYSEWNLVTQHKQQGSTKVQYIEITSWKVRAYSFYSRVVKYRKTNERVL